MKRCPCCGLLKAPTSFSKAGSRYDGLQSECKECKKARDRRYYKTSAARRLDTRKRRDLVWNRNRKIVAKHLLSHPCRDCGETDIRVLEFDHLRNKVASISKLIKSATAIKLLTEMSKCVVRCANCHKRKTYRGSWREKLFINCVIGKTSGSGPENESSSLSF